MRGNVAIIINASLCARARAESACYYLVCNICNKKHLLEHLRFSAKWGASLHVWIIKVWKVPTGMSILCPCKKDTDVML